MFPGGPPGTEETFPGGQPRFFVFPGGPPGICSRGVRRLFPGGVLDSMFPEPCQVPQTLGNTFLSTVQGLGT